MVRSTFFIREIHMSNGHSIIRSTIGHPGYHLPSVLWLIVLVLILLEMTSCASLPVEGSRDAEQFYRRDMELKINGQKFNGVAVLPAAGRYRIEGWLHADARLVKFTTCHREEVLDDFDDDDFEYSFTPVPGIEDQGFCPLEIGAFDDYGQHDWAFIDFRRDQKLSAQIGCNGQMYRASGVSICQSKSGLIQTVEFPVEVEASYPDWCPEVESEDRKNWSYIIAPEKCVYVFRSNEGQIHRLLSLGYHEILMR